MDWKIGLIAAFAVLILVIIVTGYVKAPPDMAYIISGMGRKKKILIGRAGIKIPFLERKDILWLAVPLPAGKRPGGQRPALPGRLRGKGSLPL